MLWGTDIGLLPLFNEVVKVFIGSYFMLYTPIQMQILFDFNYDTDSLSSIVQPFSVWELRTKLQSSLVGFI